YGGQGAPFARFGRFLTRVPTYDPMTAGFASVHGCIGAVDPVRSFGTPEQKAKFLPRLASGQALSAFALTEPCAGSDLTALRTTAVLKGDHYEVNGEKLFITNAIPGRTIGLVAMLDGKPAVFIADLPSQENENFQIVPYGLYALKHGYNNGLRFKNFHIPAENLRQRVADGSHHRAVHDDERRPLVPARPPVRRQPLRHAGPVHLRGRRRDARHGVLQDLGETPRHAVLRADRQGAAAEQPPQH